MNSASPSSIRREYRQGARAEAAEITGQRIVGAFLTALRQQWLEDITLEQVARDAGVSVQTVIRRFGGKPGLLEAVAELVELDVRSARGLPRGDIETTVANLCTDYESTGDMLVRLLAQEARHPALQPLLALGRAHHRQWVAEVTEPWIEGLDAPAREAALDAIVASLDVYVWNLLRRDMGRSADQTRATILGMAQAILRDLKTSGR
ncbi:TetR/AcrR family transcriptional regulator [Phenylobacterium sp. LjRoot225]|uniref:TetR/AcrR family transcriptional regulator n=1 Tax=Phenylobacterium sp. LjRoot225 TaxID=3342285 RepID=UPI003ECEA65D